MRIVLLAGAAVTAAMLLAACGEKPATDGASTETASSPPATEPSAPAPSTSSHPADAAAFSKYLPWNHALPDVRKTGSGVEYIVLAGGDAAGVAPKASQEAEVYYEGRLNSGGPAFDSAFERGETATFPVNAVVPGFSEALQLMKPGDRWLVFIPSKLGYGERGAGGDIPPNADLVFEIEMVKVH